MSEFTTSEQKLLLDLARESITFGLKKNFPLKANHQAYPAKLLVERASFVTLKVNNALRGCIGSLKAYEPLIDNVAHNAYAAAFEDPRFLPLTSFEMEVLKINISILSIPRPIDFTSEQDLLCKIKPNIDGLILTERGLCGTFLPSVWEELQDPHLFLQHLKMKAGLPPTYWSDSIKIECYATESFGD